MEDDDFADQQLPSAHSFGIANFQARQPSGRNEVPDAASLTLNPMNGA
jgi:hypothetical protein